jgi:hypothetical protein
MASCGRQHVQQMPECLADQLKQGSGQEWIRTTEGVKPADLQSAPFGRFGTYPFARRSSIYPCAPQLATGISFLAAIDTANPTLLFEMALLRGIFWFGLFLVLTFCFVVLFDYGPRDFANGAQKEYARVKSFVVKRTEEIWQTKKDR